MITTIVFSLIVAIAAVASTLVLGTASWRILDRSVFMSKGVAHWYSVTVSTYMGVSMIACGIGTGYGVAQALPWP